MYCACSGGDIKAKLKKMKEQRWVNMWACMQGCTQCLIGYVVRIIAVPEGEASNLDTGLTGCLYVCNIYCTVGRSIANISDPRRHVYRGAKSRGKYATEVGYRGYRPTYRAIYTI